MINTQAIKGKIVERGLTQEKVAKMLGITGKTFSAKLKKGVFGTDEAEALIKILGIENPVDIFFFNK